MYARSSGQYGTHGWQVRVVAVGRILYVAVRVFNVVHGHRFQAIHGRPGRFDVVSFALLPGAAVLHVLDHNVTFSAGNLNPDLHKANYQTFQTPRARAGQLQSGLYNASTAGKKGKQAEEEE
jgi:hypothetical protein